MDIISARISPYPTDPRRRLIGKSTRQISEAQEQAARLPGCAAGLPDLRRRRHDQSTSQFSGSRERAARRSWMCCRPSRTLGAGCTVRAPGSLPDLRRLPHVQNTRRIPEAQERATRQPWMRCRPSRILDVGRTVGTPRWIPGAQKQAARFPGCAATFRSLSAGHVGRDAREPSGSSEPATRSKPREASSSPSWVRCRPSESPAPAARSEHPDGSPDHRSRQLAGPACAACLPDPRRRPRGQRRQRAFRIFGAGRTVRAPGNPPKHRSRHLAGPGCAAAFRIFGTGCTVKGAGEPAKSSAPAARSETSGSPPDLQHLQHSQNPGESPKPGSGQLAGLECTVAFPEPRRRSTVKSAERSPKHGSRRLTGPGCPAASGSSAPAVRSETSGEPSGSPPPATRSEHQADLRSPGAGSSRALDVLQPPGSSPPATWSETPGSLRILTAGSSIRERQAGLRSPGADTSPPWVRCSFPDPRRWPCSQRGQVAHRFLCASHTIRGTRQISEVQEQAARRPWMR